MNRWNLWTDTLLLWLDFGNVTLSNINRDPKNLPKNWAVVNQDFATDSWVYLLVSSHGMPINHRAFPAVAHPIHLHGHDFAILQQSSTQYKVGGLNLKLDNPPRRDVALLPKDGFLVIAFKADNPGSGSCTATSSGTLRGGWHCRFWRIGRRSSSAPRTLVSCSGFAIAGMSGILYRTALRGSFRTTLAFEDGQQNDDALGRLARKRGCRMAL